VSEDRCRTAEAVMWDLAKRHAGRVVYMRGVKADGLSRDPPAIDCSGWVAFLLSSAMQAENEARSRGLFGSDHLAAVDAWSDRIIGNLEQRGGGLVAGQAITASALPRIATIGLNLGTFGWEGNRPRTRGINHVVQVVRRPGDDVAFVTEAVGLEERCGLFLTPLADWLAWAQPFIRDGRAWAADPFASSR
jgi:hypothetical protein